MRIVIDTNVVISAIFFKGKPFYILKKVVEHPNDIEAFASPEILSEYNEIYKRMIEKKNRAAPRGNPLDYFVSSLSIINGGKEIHVSRDPDDDKFIECALNCDAIYIISGDRDLLDIKEYEGVKIVTVDEFLGVLK